MGGDFRTLVIANSKIGELSFSAEETSPAVLYKHIFALWMLSYETEGSLPFDDEVIVGKLKEALVHSRVEKVVRLSLTRLRNLLTHQAVAGQIQARMQEMSNFDRYLRELEGGRLKWGFIHSSKFWAENVLKFEQNDWKALKELALLLNSCDSTTQAVACHDLGEFVTLHPLGKRQIAGLGVKDGVMKLMALTSETNKE